ncbi:MAG TPA: hydrogenase maturation protease, partial [Gemmatimonadaceae bacterium]|nr:hydrogenase maturation protease [Gemmatimonadaceae bacterium]
VTTDGEPHFSVTIDDDPGRDLGGLRYPGHRFFFRADEIEVLDVVLGAAPAVPRRILVAGIGNIFFADDAFGVAVARALEGRAWPAGVTISDFGIRGLDLAYALQDGYDAAILIDAMSRGAAPGTIHVIEPALDAGGDAGPALNAHGMDPVRVLMLARSLGRIPKIVIVVGCEPQDIGESESFERALLELSPPVAAAVRESQRVVERLIEQILNAPSGGEEDVCR